MQKIFNHLKFKKMIPLLCWLLVGLAAGYLGSLIFKGKRKGKGKGLLLYLVIGLVGGLVGGWVFGLLGVGGGGLLWQLISATAGAIILLWIVSLIRK